MTASRALEVARWRFAVVTGGLYTVRRALSAARTFSLDINVLMLVAVFGAVLIGEWFEAATVVFLFALAQFLEARSMDRARGAIRALMDVTPVEALVRRDGAERRVSVDDVAVGDTIIVKPGEKIPLDGRVAAGQSHVNQAPVTGESLPIDKGPGDDVFAGTINGRGAIEVIVTRPRRDTTLARIIHLVERAQAQRAPSQAFVDRFARWYTPAVLVLALGIATVPPLAAGEPAGPWLYRALVLLVISCPCALVISTPVSIVSALAAAARKGVLIKGGVHLERTGAVRCVAFDKTGTLTKGRVHVTEIEALDGASADAVLGLAASLELRSEHPIGRAIVRRAEAAGIALTAGDSFQALPGRGAQARIAGTTAVVGNHRLFEERGLCSPKIHDRLDALAARGRTAVLVARGSEAIGVIGVADELREAGRDAIDLLRQQGVTRVALLTGDNAETANAIGARDRGGRGARRAAARRQGVGDRRPAASVRHGRHGRRRRERRPGAGHGRRRHRDGRGRQRRRAGDGGRRADGRRAAEDSVCGSPEPRDRPQHPHEHRLLARPQGHLPRRSPSSAPPRSGWRWSPTWARPSS